MDIYNIKMIFDFISKNPGLHFNEIKRKIKIPKSTLRYHLNFLEKNEFIKSKKIRRYTCYFIKGVTGRQEKIILHYLNNKITRRIIVRFMLNKVNSCNNLSEELQLNRNTINFHLKNLKKNDIIVEVKQNNGILRYDFGERKIVILTKVKTNQRYYRLNHPWETYNTIISNRKIIDDDVFSKIIMELGEEFFSYNRDRNFFDRKKVVYERFIDNFFELFPHPYHI